MSIKKRTTTEPLGSYAGLDYMNSLAFGFRDPEVYLIAKVVRRVVDAGENGDKIDIDPLLLDCAKDIIEHHLK